MFLWYTGETLFFHLSGMNKIWRKDFDKGYYYKRVNGEFKNVFHTVGQIDILVRFMLSLPLLEIRLSLA